jgi:hypothetical protein
MNYHNDPMLILRVKGGLGNQLFQYATARAVAEKRGLHLKLDSETGFSRDTYERAFRLNCFAITAETATRAEVEAARLRWGLHTLLARRVEGLLIAKRRSNFCPLALRVAVSRRGGYLEGYWHSEEYFKSIRDLLRREFSILIPHDSITASYCATVRSCNSVAVHVRRIRFAYQCNMEYYVAALSLLRQKVGNNLTVFLFSDDTEWALTQGRSVFKDFIQVPVSESDGDIQQLRVFSACRHHVLANSTFGWWGAWLADDENHVVIAPRVGWDGTDRVIDHILPARWCAL